ncbi:MAG: hypothetical protein EHM61_18605 [Acidobacteria bacterium]|nr:MAG: hypothetical protein EHM61_18605 [Acidobacteriota bacterium]
MQSATSTRSITDQKTAISLLAGGSLIGLALAKFSRLSWILGIAGAYLVYCGLSTRKDADRRSQPTSLTDIVLEASEESFPASDAPSWTTGH